jgi:hypothetical protein
MMSAVEAQLQEQVALGNVKLNFFTFNLTFLAVATGTPTPQVFQISNNMNFLLQYITGAVFQPAGTVIASPDLLLQLSDVSSGWLYSDNPVHWGQTVGTSQLPFILPEPKLIPSNASIQARITNNGAVTLARIDLALQGVQVFTYNGFDIYDLPVVG